jgi:hypothetical protein|tara:strand:- start:538 stop:864 length:327 start_codon:yes stop_codon:yes gene_type:complete
MEIDELKQAVLRNLSKGQAKALTGKQLQDRLGERDTRSIRLSIIDLIVQDGHAIIGDSKGYYLAETKEECDIALDTLRNSYGMMLFRHYKYLKIARNKKFSGQLEMRL